MPGRYIGEFGSVSGAANLYVLDGAYRSVEGGVPLSTLVDRDVVKSMPQSDRPDWGAMGLPNGLETRVRPLSTGDGSNDDVTVALASSGYRRYLDDRSLSIAPGDVVDVGGEKARLIAVDRRRRTVEVEINGTTREIGFQSIDDLESDV
ncbi:MAG TPA: hypothetical protein VD789_06425 [Thermomicrobiales bacterium]|nr:hypothetical protein [Thermomicrobiales bacterium]